jgi:hypothetical protein
VTERTNAGDAIGVGAYGLVIVLIESILVLLATLLLGFLVSKKWNETRRISLIGTLTFIVSIWAILGQLYFLLDCSIPKSWIQALASNAHPLQILYALSFSVVVPTVLISAYGQLKSRRLNKITYEFFDRISLLVILYLVFDVISIVIVIIRNL